MTSTKRSGVYFSETTTSTGVEYEQQRIPLFIVQTSTAIADLDGVITHYTGIDAFKTAVTGKGLTQTVKYIEDILNEYELSEFYVYSIKTDTAIGFTDAIKSTAHLDDVTSITYIEETKSANANTINSKIAAIKAGLDDNYANGVFRMGFIVPYGTVSDAVSNASNTTSEAACIASLTTILSGTGSGRICVPLPDANAGIVIGKCLATPYDENPGFDYVASSPAASEYNFDNTQLLTLQNLGVMVLAKETFGGVTSYRIDEGVTTSFKSNASDGYYVDRAICDEFLRGVRDICRPYVKAKESATTVEGIRGDIAALKKEFVAEESIVDAGTTISVNSTGNNTLTVSGTVQPVGTVHTIDVAMTIQ